MGNADVVGEKTSKRRGRSCREVGVVRGFSHLNWGREKLGENG